MKLVNRGFLSIRPKQAFWDWANAIDAEVTFDEEDDIEPTVYLVEEDFFEIEPVIEKNFKKIFAHELSMISEEEDSWPENRSMEQFILWFDIDFGSIVVDLEKSDLESEKV